MLSVHRVTESDVRVQRAWAAIDEEDELGDTSLEPSETFEDFWRRQTREQSTIHAGTHTARIATARALHAGGEEHRRRAERLRDCSSVPVFGVGADHKAFVAFGLCRDRLCPLCASKRSTELASRVAARVSTFDSARFLTLTVRSTDSSLAGALEHLAESFRRFRQRDAWRKHVTAAVYAVEVTFNTKSQQWHPHIHIIADGSFWAQRDVAAEWQAATGDSCIVDIRACTSRHAAAKYISKYVCKVGSVERWPPERIREFATTMSGKRLINTLGKARGQKISEAVTDDTPHDRTFLAPVAELRERLERGADHLRLAAAVICRTSKCLRALLLDTLHDVRVPDCDGEGNPAQHVISWAAGVLTREFNPDDAPQPRREVEEERKRVQALLWHTG